MRTFFAVMFLVGCFAGVVGAEKISAFNWCTFTTTDGVTVGETLQITIDVKMIPKGQKLVVGLHGRSTNGDYLGMNMHGQIKDVVSGSNVTVEIIPAVQKDLGSVHVVAFLSPTGKWEDMTQVAKGKDVQITP